MRTHVLKETVMRIFNIRCKSYVRQKPSGTLTNSLQDQEEEMYRTQITQVQILSHLTLSPNQKRKEIKIHSQQLSTQSLLIERVNQTTTTFTLWTKMVFGSIRRAELGPIQTFLGP